MRQKKGWTQATLAYHAGMGPTAVNQIETGRREPSAGSLRKLADALGVSIPDLFEGADSGKAFAPSLPFDESERRAKAEDLAAHIRWRAGEIEREIEEKIPAPDPSQPYDGEEVYRLSSAWYRERDVYEDYRGELKPSPDDEEMIEGALERLEQVLEAGRARDKARGGAWDRAGADLRERQPARPGIGGE